MKFMNLYLPIAMQKIVNRNNTAYKTDLRYDMEKIKEDESKLRNPDAECE